MFCKAQEVIKITNQQNPSKIFLLNKLGELTWFNRSKPNIKKIVSELSGDYDFVLADFLSKPLFINNMEIIRLKNLSVFNTMVIPVFEVVSNLTNEKFDYEYVIWKNGNHPNSRGIVLIEVEGKIKYFLSKKTSKFPINEAIYDTLNSFYPQFNGGSMINLPSKTDICIKKLLDQQSLKIKRFIDLGKVYSDSSLTSNCVSIFGIIIESNGVFKTTLRNNEFEIQKIENLIPFLSKTNDSYFLAIAARLFALNIIK